jgi:hypothetical protein
MKDKYIVRDNQNEGAILNTDNSGLAAYKARKQRDREMDAKVGKLESDIAFIKALLLEKLK